MTYLLTVLMLTLTLTSAWTGTLQSRSRLAPILGHRLLDTGRSFLNQQLFSIRSSSSSCIHTKSHDNSADDHDRDADGQIEPQNIAIVGGGLAGLSTAFHLLEKTQSRCRVTIFDTAPVGTAGASSVAGGYVTFTVTALVIALFHSCYSSVIIDIFATLD
jgi:hypothetical protein